MQQEARAAVVTQIAPSQATSYFRVLVLGPFALERDGVAETTSWQRRVEVLFKLLATAPDRQRLRDDLIDILWPNTGPETGTGNLRMLVHRLRQTLNADPSPITTEHGWVALNPVYSWELDLDQLEAVASDPGADLTALEQAARLYRGEPLVEERYEDWAVPVRDRAARAWRQLCFRLADTHRSRGAYAEAPQWFERVLADDPTDEEALRGLLAALADLGKPADALRRYRYFEERLQEELDVPPSAETVALVEEIRAELESPSAISRQRQEEALPVGRFLGAMPEQPLIGRDDEMERISFAIDAAREGAGRLVLLSGEAGVGKTRLAQEVMMRLREEGFTIATGRCYEQYTGVPFYPFLTLLPPAYAAAPTTVRQQALQRWPQLRWLLTDASPGAETGPPDDGDQVALFRAVTGLLTALTEERPLALLLDDLQRADDGSLELLQHLARFTQGCRIVLLATYRDGDISAAHPLNAVVRELNREGLLERVPVARLGPEMTAALVEATLGEMASPAEFNDFVYRRTKGNPFFIERMLRPLGGRYRLIRQIGMGGMGRVFEAVDMRNGEVVAAKIMFARSETDPRSLLRFQQEGAVLAALDHPNIVKVHATYVEEFAGCIIMELLGGKSLGQILRSGDLEERGVMPLARAKHLMRQVALALAAAHERHIVHRDIKPDNIMVDDDDHVTVTDFGIARMVNRTNLSTLTSTGMTVGTPLYVAPEQIEGRKIDGRADIYALGAVIYEMITGRPPFQADDPMTVAYKHAHEAPVPPRWMGSPWISEVPEDWEALILKALAKDPNDRFQTAVAMERAIAGLSTRNGKQPPAPASRQEMVRHAAGEVRHAAGEVRHAAGEVLPAGEVVAVAPVEAGVMPRQRRIRETSRAWVISAALAAMVVLAGALFLFQHLTVSSQAQLPSGTGSGQFNEPTGLAVDGKGIVSVVDEGNNRIQEIDRDGRPVLAVGTAGQGNSQFNSPSDLALAPSGDVEVSDASNKRIVILRAGSQIDEIPLAPVSPGSIAIDSHGTIYTTDYKDHQILKVAADGTSRTALNVRNVEVGPYPYPAGIAVDVRGDIYVPDRLHNVILILSPTGQLVRKLGTPGTNQVQFNRPSDVALDRRGNIYVADTGNDRIQKLSPKGIPLGAWGTTGSKLGQFRSPVSVAVDDQGNIYVSDFYNNRIQKLSPTGKPLWATDGLHPLTH